MPRYHVNLEETRRVKINDNGKEKKILLISQFYIKPVNHC